MFSFNFTFQIDFSPKMQSRSCMRLAVWLLEAVSRMDENWQGRPYLPPCQLNRKVKRSHPS